MNLSLVELDDKYVWACCSILLFLFSIILFEIIYKNRVQFSFTWKLCDMKEKTTVNTSGGMYLVYLH